MNVKDIRHMIKYTNCQCSTTQPLRDDKTTQTTKANVTLKKKKKRFKTEKGHDIE